MASWSLELKGCFTTGSSDITTEFRPCGQPDEAQVFASFTDGTNWLDVDGATLVGWIEMDGVTFYPPSDVVLG